MKIVLPIFGLIALLGIAYGLAFFGIIPAQKIADKTPALASVLISLHLAKAKKPVLAAKPGATLSPGQVALNAQKKQLAADQAQLDKDRAAFESQKQTASVPSADGSSAAPQPDPTAKLDAIYAAMSPDDLTPLFSKLSDTDVARALLAMDEKKAGKILAALPTTRAAQLTRRMAISVQTAALVHESL
jgi:flagellar motility protein MotE (MotC chaperone)